LAGDCTGLKPGVNEKNLTNFPARVIMRK